MVEWAGVLVVVALIVAAVSSLHLQDTISSAVRCDVERVMQGSGCAFVADRAGAAGLGPANPSTPTGGTGPTQGQEERILGSNRLIFACAGTGQSELGADLAPDSKACKAQLAKLSPHELATLELMAAVFQTEHDYRPGQAESKQRYFQTLLGFYLQDPGTAVVALSRGAQRLQSGPILRNEKLENTQGDLWDGFLGSMCGGYGVCLGGTVLSQAYQQAYRTSAQIAKITTPVLLATGIGAAVKDLAGAGLKTLLAKLGSGESGQLESAVKELESEAAPASPRGISAQGGESAAAAYGRQMHAEWDPGPGYEKEFRLPSSKRVDAVNFQTRDVEELKPDTPAAKARGERQLQGYIQELDEEFPGKPFTGRVVTYPPYQP